MQVSVNGVKTELAPATTVAVFVAGHSPEQRCVAVALNGDVVPRNEWDVTLLTAGDTLEVLAPIAGG